MVYSHIWDGLLKLISLGVLMVIAVKWVGLDQRIQPLWLMIAIVAAVWFLLYRQLLAIVASWLYARLGLRTNVTFTEATALRKLFQLDLSGKWIPLREIKKLPAEQRHEALLAALQKIGPSRKALLF
jgi:hypothetical protein